MMGAEQLTQLQCKAGRTPEKIRAGGAGGWVSTTAAS